jgi:hypothetical protein
MVVGGRSGGVAKWRSGSVVKGEYGSPGVLVRGTGVPRGEKRRSRRGAAIHPRRRPHAERGGTREQRPRGRRVLYHRCLWVRWGAMLWGLVVGLRGGRFGRLRR